MSTNATAYSLNDDGLHKNDIIIITINRSESERTCIELVI